ncbi:hypothetical protein TNCV_1589961 [Trichonephila clavipes]|uniref:Uncharacterized protein n=1 Tax=Trichonephila clavipes TaxID=2585209 RepID=A0A8X6RGQ9_TRICX|nr:hypothetical protein TNCV_1589961 [Trichonephila clavipes]
MVVNSWPVSPSCGLDSWFERSSPLSWAPRYVGGNSIYGSLDVSDGLGKVTSERMSALSYFGGRLLRYEAA